MKKLFSISVIILTMFMFSCSSKEVKAPAKPDKEVAKEEISTRNIDAEKAAAEKAAAEKAAAEKAAAEKAAAEKAAAEKAAAEKAAAEKAAAEKAAAEKAAAEASVPFADIHFDYDKSDIRPDDQATLKEVSGFMIANANAIVSAEGHCDERGTSEYNLALGDRRAKASKDYLVSSGVSADKISTFSYGKEAPLCTEHEEPCWVKNRRVHFVVTKGGAK